ncbi:MAG: DUF3575 domain-containing protein [Candidatus Cryptobacteroides sp.]
MRKKLFIILTLAIIFCLPQKLSAQRVSLSTDLLEWCTLSPNAGVEFTVSRHSTVAVSASFSPWKVSDALWLRHVTLTPEWRWWFEVPLSGSSLGLKAVYSCYDFGGLRGTRAGGHLLGLGVVYGYSAIVNKRVSIRPHISGGGAVNYNKGRFSVFPTADIGLDIQIILK